MKHRVILSPGAKADFSSAVRWYQRTDPDIAFQFTQETLSILRRIEQFPYSFPLMGGHSSTGSAYAVSVLYLLLFKV